MEKKKTRKKICKGCGKNLYHKEYYSNDRNKYGVYCKECVQQRSLLHLAEYLNKDN